MYIIMIGKRGDEWVRKKHTQEISRTSGKHMKIHMVKVEVVGIV